MYVSVYGYRLNCARSFIPSELFDFALFCVRNLLYVNRTLNDVSPRDDGTSAIHELLPRTRCILRKSGKLRKSLLLAKGNLRIAVPRWRFRLAFDFLAWVSRSRVRKRARVIALPKVVKAARSPTRSSVIRSSK